MSLIVFLIIVIGIVVFFANIYNKMVAARNDYKNSFAQIDVQLTRRYDLIPNLVAAAKKYMEHESQTLEAVVSARNQAKSALEMVKSCSGNNESIKNLTNAESVLSSSMSGFLAVAENYPELKASETIARLMEEISSTENRIAFARQNFNDLVTQYNSLMQVFPNNFVANNFGFKTAELLDIKDIEIKRDNVKVSFD